MDRLPKLGVLGPIVWFATVVAMGGADAYTPRAFSIADFPAGAAPTRATHPTRSGWVFAAEGGVLWQSDGMWKRWRPKSGRVVRVALPLAAGGWVVAGEGFASRVAADGVETPILGSGNFTSGAVLGDTALIAEPAVVYAIGPNGIVARRNLSATSVEVMGVYVHLIDDRLIVFAPNDGIFVFRDGEFHDASNEFAWAKGRAVVSILPVGDGMRIAHTDAHLLLVPPNGGEPTVLIPEIWNSLKERLRVGATMIGDTVVIGTLRGGLTGFGRDGSERWQLGIEDLDGNPYFLRPLPDGLIIGTSNGVTFVPDSSRFAFAKLPAANPKFVVNSSRGTLIGTAAGVFHVDGRKADFAIINGLIETPAGFVEGHFGSLSLPSGQTIPINQRDDAVMQLMTDGQILVRHGEHVRIVGLDGSVEKLNLPFPVNSATVVGAELLFGSNDGARRVTATGVETARFGERLTRVRTVEDVTIAVDADGNLFTADGEPLGRLPFTEILSAAKWENGLALLARAADGRLMIGKVELSPFRWLPYDLPVRPDARLIARDRERLLVISPGEIMAVTAPRHLPAPAMVVALTAARDGRTLGAADSMLAASEDSVDVELPPSRLGPWANPAYAVKVNDGGWQEVAPGARVRVARLPWGHSMISVRASLAGLETDISLPVRRAYPMWLRWPAFVLYLVGSVAFGWSIVRWRTARLARRALELQSIVDERTAELKQAQKAREEFFSTLSHEIRNPLNGVVGLCDILDEAPGGAVAPRERMLVRTLKGCASQLRSMLDDVLDFSRIDRGEIQLHEESFELNSAIEGAARSIDAGLAKVTLELPDVTWLQGDCGKFRQVLTNLVSNALKYGIPSAARVVGTTTVEQDGRVRVRVSVFNTGHTVPATELERIFGGFVRGEDALRRRIPGSGLGLAVSRRMAIAMGGSLDAFSKDGLTEFRVETIMTLGEAPAETVPANAPKISRALAIEDEPYNRLVLGHILSQLGYEVDWAVDGTSALERVRGEAYDLLLTDYLLPDINGAELARRILLEVPEPKPPVICVTAYSTPEKIAEARAAGISGFVTKPVSRRKLESAILGLGSQFQARRSLDVARTKVECDFSSLLRLDDGSRVLAEYAEALPGAWTGTVSLIDRDADEGAKAVHAFRSRILAVHANSVGEQLAVLEDSLRAGHQAEVRRLVDLIGSMVDDLAAAARARAFAAVN